MEKQGNTKKPKEKVVVFGEEVSDHKHSRDDVVFGVLLLLAGIVLLLNTLGLVTWEIWNDLWKYWPLLLILGGLNIILGRNPLSRLLSFILSLFVFGTAIIYVLQTKSPEILKYIPKKIIELSDYWEVIGR